MEKTNLGKLGIVRSKNIKELNEETLEFLNDAELYVGTIIHGNDNLIEEWANNKNIKTEIINPIKIKSELSHLFRDIEIVALSDMLLVLWDKESKDVKFIKDYAELREKQIKVI